MSRRDRNSAMPGKRGREEEDSELFCGSLSWKATEDDVHDLFSKYGEVLNVKLLKDYEGRSRGRAFVMLSSSREASDALRLDGKEHMGRQIVVKYSSDKPAPRERDSRGDTRGGHDRERRDPPKIDQENELYCSGLSWDANEDDLEDLFRSYGKVLNVKIIKDYQGRSRGRAFVKLSSAEECEAALAVNGQEHMGRDISVNKSSDKPAQQPSKTVYVRNMSYETTEETLNDFFSECGEIVDVRIAMSVGGKSRGFAHVEFDSAESSAKACKLAGEEIDGRPVQILFAKERVEKRRY